MACRIRKLELANLRDQAIVADSLFIFMRPEYEGFYPNFGEWYFTKVLPGFVSGHRVIYIAESDDEIQGVALLKIPDQESKSKKICSLFLSRSARGSGLGKDFLTASIEEFSKRGGGKALLTVPEERVGLQNDEGSFGEFLQKNGFGFISSLQGRYRPGKKEYVFERIIGSVSEKREFENCEKANLLAPQLFLLNYQVDILSLPAGSTRPQIPRLHNK